MSMLGQLQTTYRWQVLNSTGQTLATSAVVVKFKPGKYLPTGALSLAAVATEYTNSGSTITNGSYGTGGTIDNSANLYLGGMVEFTVTAPASSNGDVILYLQRSVDGGTTWEDSGLGIPVAVLNFTTSGTKRIVRAL
jgi:hypothetical protein